MSAGPGDGSGSIAGAAPEGGRFDVVGLGSAIVDLIATVDHAVLRATGLTPGTMTLVDAEEAERLWEHTAGAAVVAGGSAANTCAGVAALGGSVAFVGRVGDDELGRSFAEDLRAAGVAFEAPAPAGTVGTGRCTVFVTPDGERTMRTYLGAAPLLDVHCVDEAVVGGADFVYLEGYLWDAPDAGPAVARAMEVARRGGGRVALSLSDPGCVERHRSDLQALLEDGAVDVLFGNESEALELTGAASLEGAAGVIGTQVAVAALTRGPGGCLVVADGASVGVPAHRVERVVDTTGAGDLFAAGFLLGLARRLGPADCARLGGLAAADVISAVGARPHSDIRAAAAAQGLIP